MSATIVTDASGKWRHRRNKRIASIWELNERRVVFMYDEPKRKTVTAYTRPFTQRQWATHEKFLADFEKLP